MKLFVNNCVILNITLQCLLFCVGGVFYNVNADNNHATSASATNGNLNGSKVHEEQTNGNSVHTSSISTNDKHFGEDKTNNNQSLQKFEKNKHELNDLTYLPIYYLTTVLTILLYSFIMLSLIRRRRSSTSVFIASLAVADLFVSVVIIPLKISEIYGALWQKQINICRLVNCLTLLSIAMASINILLISMNRILFFLKPMKYKKIVNFRMAVIACCVGYFLATPTLLPILGVMSETPDNLKFCAFKFTLSKSYLWIIGISYFLLPAFVIIITQILILALTAKYFHLRRSTAKCFKNSSDDSTTTDIRLQTTKIATCNTPSLKKGLRIQRMFLFIIIMFFICWGPFVAGIVCNLVAQHLITPVFIQVMRIFVFTNSFINPLIILLTNPQYLRAFSRSTSRQNRVTPTTGGRDDVTVRSSFFTEQQRIFLVDKISRLPRKPQL